MKRTAQDLLAERRSLVQERRRETDKTARALLQYSIDEIDRQLRWQTSAVMIEMPDFVPAVDVQS